MIVLDTSALVVLYGHEPEAADFHRIIATAAALYIPASAIVEFSLIRRLGRNRISWLFEILDQLGVDVGAIDGAVARIAAEAAERYGRGSGHPARLNFGDCLSYAVAKRLDAPLLFKGDDFVHTDVRSAVAA